MRMQKINADIISSSAITTRSDGLKTAADMVGQHNLHYSKTNVVKFLNAGWFAGWMQARLQAMAGRQPRIRKIGFFVKFIEAKSQVFQ